MNTQRIHVQNHRFNRDARGSCARTHALVVGSLRAIASVGFLLIASCDGATPPPAPKPEVPACDDGSCEVSECPACGDDEHCVEGQCVCRPDCDADDACDDDGCGGVCECPEGMGRDPEGNIKPLEECKDSCATAGWQCGVVCGERCGTCDDGADCNDGQCGCVPQCDGTSCSDGCGGSCECAPGKVCNATDACVAPSECHDSCASTDRSCGSVCGNACGSCENDEACIAYSCQPGLSCEHCSLRLQLLDRRTAGGTLTQVRLAVYYAPTEGEPRARIADLRIAADKNVELVAVEQGPALDDAEKSLFADPTSGELFQRRDDGAFQLLAIGTLNTRPLADGSIATLTFRAKERGPVRFSLQRRMQTLAPAPADGALQTTEYDHAVVVTP